MHLSRRISPLSQLLYKVMGIALAMTLLPSMALGYTVKTTVANVDWDPRLEGEGETDTTPIRWFDSSIEYRVSGTSTTGLIAGDFTALVQDAAAVWKSSLGASDVITEEQACIPDLVYAGLSRNTSGNYGAVRDDESTVYFINDPAVWAERGYDPKALAMTNIFTEEIGDVKGRIIEADIEINGAAFNFTGPADTLELETKRLGYTIEHEFGHVIGMGHSEVSTSLMYATTTDDDVSFPLELDNDDVEGACFLYREIEVPVVKAAQDASSGGCNTGSGSNTPALPMFALLFGLCAAIGIRWKRV